MTAISKESDNALPLSYIIDGRYCTDCVNELCGSNVERRHCYHSYYMAPCRRCGSMRHLVKKVPFRTKIRLKRDYKRKLKQENNA